MKWVRKKKTSLKLLYPFLIFKLNTNEEQSQKKSSLKNAPSPQKNPSNRSTSCLFLIQILQPDVNPRYELFQLSYLLKVFNFLTRKLKLLLEFSCFHSLPFSSTKSSSCPPPPPKKKKKKFFKIFK